MSPTALVPLLHLLVWGSPADAARWAERRWSVEQGLPQRTPTSLAQGADGRLVLGTFGGLARFDGDRFETWDSASADLPSIRVTSVAIAADGALWVGAQEGAVARLESGRAVALVADRPLGVVWSLAEADGALWVACDAGVAEVVGGVWRWRLEVQAFDVAVIPGLGAAAATTGGLFWIQRGGPRRFAGVPAGAEIADLAVDADVLWTAGPGGVGRIAADGTFTLVDPGPATRVAAARGLVLAAEAGSVRLAGGAELWRGEHAVRSLLIDQEGSAWVGTTGGGLVQLRPVPFSVERTSNEPLTVLPHPEGGWLEAGCGSTPVVWRRRDGSRTPLPANPGEAEARGERGRRAPPEPSPAVCVRAMAWVGERLWIGRSNAVAILGQDGIEQAWELGAEVLAIGPGGRFAGTSAGAWQREGDRWRPVDGIEGQMVPVIVEDEAGHTWFGGPAALHRWDGAAWTRWTRAEGLPHGQVRDIAIDGPFTWVGTYGGGLVRLGPDGARRLSTTHGLAENVVSRIVQARGGAMWLQGNRGVSRVTAAELHAALDGAILKVQARTWMSGEGVGGAAPAGALIGDEVVFPTLDGIVRFPLEAVTESPPAPPVIVLAASVDGASVLGAEPTVVGPGPGHARIDFTAALLSEPELLRFRYRLNGQPWLDLGDERVLRWESLEPGAHEIEITAANASGAWGAEPAVIRFAIRRSLPARWDVRGAAAAAVVLLIAGAWRLRARAIAEHMGQLKAQIQQRRRAEAALRESEAHYRRVFEGVGDGLIVTDQAGLVVDANPAAQALFRDPGLAGSPIAPRIGAEVAEGVVVCTRSDGSTFEAAVAQLNHGGAEKLVTVSDLTQLREAEAERRKLAEERAQAQRLEAIGRLAGRVAHDVNNLLTVLSSSSEVLRHELRAAPPPHVALDLVGDIEACVRRGGELTRQLMAFSQQQKLAPATVEVGAHLARWVPMLARAVREDVRLVFEPPLSPAWAHVDTGQLEMAVLNLVLNAAAVSPAGERVTLRVRAADGAVAVEVADRGPGIPPEMRERILEPFFTTRRGGTGLGLPSVQGFAAQSGGELQVDSLPGEGATFRIVLPAVPAAEASAPEPPGEPAPQPVRPRLLVCDDDRQVLSALARMLQRMGHVVEAFDDPTLLLERVGSLDGYAALITDVLMPSLTGPELATRLRARRPDLPVIFISGYTHDVPIDPALGRMLAKPFVPAELREALDGILRPGPISRAT